MSLHRRSMLAAGLALATAPAGAEDKLTVFAHRVHKTVATGAQGGDITAA